MHCGLVHLSELMTQTEGRPEIAISLVDGPVNENLPQFGSCTIKDISNSSRTVSEQRSSFASMHATLVASVLIGERGTATTAICPKCTLLVRPIFEDAFGDERTVPTAHPDVLASAILDSISAGARIINLSCGISHSTARNESRLQAALSFAAQQGVIVVASAGNDAAVGGSCITKHPWVIPVVATDGAGKPTSESTLGASIGQRGLAAPGKDISAVSSDGNETYFSGTSAACPFVSGAAALLWSEFPSSSADDIKKALTPEKRRRTIVPPLLNAWNAFRLLTVQSEVGTNE